jgi:adenylyltransferase/sulfurtransferase
MILPGFSEEAQARLRRSHAVVVGCGALGCASIDLLVRAGVGRLTLIDRDEVEESNLQRQSLFTDEDARRSAPKAEAAARRVRAIDPSCEVRGWVDDFRAENARIYAEGASVLIDGLDNFEGRYLLNDVALELKLPYIYCAAVGYEGISFPVIPSEGPCLRCIFPEPPPVGSAPTCDRAGIFGPAIAIAAGRAMATAIRLLAGVRCMEDRALVRFDLASGRESRIALDSATRSRECPACGRGLREFLSGGRAARTATLCGRNAVQVLPDRLGAIDLADLAARLAPHGAFTIDAGRLRGELAAEPTVDGQCFELTIFDDGRTIVRGSPDPADALRIYSRYIGH